MFSAASIQDDKRKYVTVNKTVKNIFTQRLDKFESRGFGYKMIIRKKEKCIKKIIQRLFAYILNDFPSIF